MKNYSVEEKGEKAYLVEHTTDGDMVDMVMPLPSAGGGGEVPPPNTVGSEQIKDGGIGVVDVDEEVKEGLDELNNITLTDKDIEDIFYEQ